MLEVKSDFENILEFFFFSEMFYHAKTHFSKNVLHIFEIIFKYGHWR